MTWYSVPYMILGVEAVEATSASEAADTVRTWVSEDFDVFEDQVDIDVNKIKET